MKRYEITIDGRTFDVTVLSDPQQAQVEVEVDGEVLVIEVRSPAVTPTPASAPAVPAPAGPTETPPAPAASAAPVTPAAGSAVVAPLPGVVKRVMVEPGEAVEPGQALLVIEAMKMDNVIRASKTGIVEAVHTAEGHQVAHGDTLLDFA